MIKLWSFILTERTQETCVEGGPSEGGKGGPGV